VIAIESERLTAQFQPDDQAENESNSKDRQGIIGQGLARGDVSIRDALLRSTDMGTGVIANVLRHLYGVTLEFIDVIYQSLPGFRGVILHK
jgi:hypothetical protein